MVFYLIKKTQLIENYVCLSKWRKIVKDSFGGVALIILHWHQ